MSTKVIESRKFTDAWELKDALEALLETTAAKNAVVYITSDGWFDAGILQLQERTLTDGSTVYDMEIVEDDEEE